MVAPTVNQPVRQAGIPIALPVPENDSGSRDATLPDEFRRFSWGAFLWSWVWALAHRRWIGLLSLVPGLGVIIWFVLGFKGNEWAWRGRRWESIERFREVQRKWARWGVALTLSSFLIGSVVLVTVVMPIFHQARINALTASSRSNLQQLAFVTTLFSQDHEEKFPSMTDATVLRVDLLPYIERQQMKESILWQPNINVPYLPNPSLSGRSEEDIESASTMMLLYEAQPREDGKRNVAFVDGHIQLVGEAEWQKIKAASVLAPKPQVVPAPTENPVTDEVKPEATQKPDEILDTIYDIPSLIGLDYDTVIANLGQPVGIAVGGNPFWGEDPKLLAIRNPNSTSIAQFALREPGGDKASQESLLALGDLSLSDERYEVTIERDHKRKFSTIYVTPR